ncbi:TPA: hypothetical protein DIV49_04025 [Candidatus Saccharibacteria bacterium]|nr:hypothetical protein [Candidatus Saccharibacteria bacterium]HRJ91387.1 AI-2E family transporter [Candidatus Saccharibacteria bacterium]
MKVHHDIDTQTFIRFWLVVIGFGLVGYAVYSARDALIILGSAFFLALILNAPVSRLARIMPGRSRAMSTAIAFVAVVLFIGAFVFLAVPPIAQQLVKFIDTLPTVVSSARTQWEGLNTLIIQYNLQSQVDSGLDALQKSTSGIAAGIGGGIIAGIGSIFSFVTAVFLVLVLAFLMLVEAPTWMERLWRLYDDKARMERHRKIAKQMNTVVSNYVTGQLTVSGLGAVFAGITVFILSFIFNIPSNLAVPAAAITFILSLIPMFGATIGGILIGLVLAFNDIGAAISYLVYFVVYQQIENNFISPTIQSKRIELSALTILASVTVGLYVFGIAGGIISIPIAGCLKVLLDSYFERRSAMRNTSSKAKINKTAA